MLSWQEWLTALISRTVYRKRKMVRNQHRVHQSPAWASSAEGPVGKVKLPRWKGLGRVEWENSNGGRTLLFIKQDE